jgi:Cu2+-exporting ATPase
MNGVSETFALTDVRCGGCVVKIERALQKTEGIEYARGNATQKRLHVTWDEGQQTALSVQHIIRQLGYIAEPMTIAEADRKGLSLMPRLCVAGFGMMNIMAVSVSVWFGVATDMGEGTMQFLHWIAAVLAFPVMLYSGWVFHDAALRALWRGRMTMDTPISIAIIVTYAASVVETVRGTEHVYFDAVIGLVFFLLVGRVLEQYMHRRTGDAAQNLRGILNISATRIGHNGQRETLQADELGTGDRVLVMAGDRIPADGVLLTPDLDVDESILTGETRPRVAKCGASLIAGSFALTGPAEMRVTHVGAASQLGQMARLADRVAAHKGELQAASDRFAASYIPLVLGGGAIGFVGWYFVLGAGFAQSLLIAISVLIVTCPCAAGLATPAVTARAMNLALVKGIIFKSGAALEKLGSCTHIFLDKTGTASVPHARIPADLSPNSRSKLLQLAAHSQHPFCQAFDDLPVTLGDDSIKEIPGKGVLGAGGIRLGSGAFVDASCRHDGSLFFRDETGQVTPIKIGETARGGLTGFLEDMSASNRSVAILSGDQGEAVSKFAEMTRIETAHAGQSPEDKLNHIIAAQRKGETVVMVGDGINDAISLGAADVSVSFSGATQVAQSVADIVIAHSGFSCLTGAIRLSEDANTLIRQNLLFSLIYNLLAVPLALAGFLSPALAALLMASSSIAVMANGMRLRIAT